MSDKHDELMKSLGEVKGEVKEQRKEIKNVQINTAKISESLEYHIRRTDLLEDMVKPMHEERISQEAIKEYKDQKKKDLMLKLKMPVLIVAALGALATFISWLGGVFSKMAAIISSVAGTRTAPMDGQVFIRGTTAVFKITFLNDGVPTTIDVGTKPYIKILEPIFLSGSQSPFPIVLETIEGELVAGQDFEYKFTWDMPITMVPLDNYIVQYQATIGGLTNVFGDEFFTIQGTIGSVGIKVPAFATVDDVRKKKFNIDDYLPKILKNDLASRNNLIEDHLRDASQRLREELSMFKARGNSENYRLFAIYYTIWSLLLASRGEDGSSVSDANIGFWRTEWERILSQEKREGIMQGIPLGRG